MNKNVRLIVLSFLALVLALGQVGTASATPTVDSINCEISPWNPTGVAPLTVTFDASKSTGAAGFTWIFPETKSMDMGTQVTHVYNYAGIFKVSLICLGTDGTSTMRVTTWIQVQADTMSAAPTLPVPPVPTPIVTPTPVVVNKGNTTNGENSPIIVISDSTDVTINTGSQTTEVAPVAPVVKTTPKSGFWAVIKSILVFFVGPANSIIDWINQNK